MPRICLILGVAFMLLVPSFATSAEPSPDLVREFQETKAKAEAGDADAQYKLAQMYVKGAGTEKNDAAAAPWYRKLAERGDPRGQSMLAVFYTNARGVPRDYDEAIKWFRKAAAQNSSHAQYNLGYMYAVGKGVAKDDVESARWYGLAAEQNDKGSQRILGGLYAAGRGVPKDLVQAYAWTSVAGDLTSDSDVVVKQLAKLTEQMTPDQQAAAKKLATEIQARVTKPKP